MPSSVESAVSSATGFKDTRFQHAEEQYHVDQPAAPGSYLGPIDATLPDADKVPLLFQPFTVKDLTLPNRIVVAPMCMFSSKDGFMTDFHLVHLGSFAAHGAGLVLAEATAVEPRGRISPSDTGIWKDEHIPAIKRVVDFVHNQGGKIGIQLAHAGRKVSIGESVSTKMIRRKHLHAS